MDRQTLLPLYNNLHTLLKNYLNIMIHKTTVSVAEHVDLVSYDYSVLP